MNRSQLEHLIRAAGDISGDDEIIVLGSMAILAQFPNAPADLLFSNEADVFPKNKPDLAQVIDGCIGELSPFHQTYSYYAHGIGPETGKNLPKGWETRLVPLKNPNTRGVAGWCLEVHDLVIGKYTSGREKDLKFNAGVIAYQMVSQKIILERLKVHQVAEPLKKTIKAKIMADFRKAKLK
jgi:hypothetical protein